MIPIRAASLCLPAFVAGILGCAVSLVAAHALDGSIIRSDLSPAERKRVAEVTKPTADFSKAEPYEAMEGGATTSIAPVTADAFSQPSANLDKDKGLDFHLGNALFRQLWVSSPSSTQATDGLGPLFNARSCQTCHIKDGRGHPLEADGNASSMLLRLARPAKTPEEQKAIASLRAINFPDPTYGTQLQDLAVPGLSAEGRVAVTYSEQNVTLAGGETVSLRKPSYSAADLAYGPLDPETTLSRTPTSLHAPIPTIAMVTAFPARRQSCVTTGRASLRWGASAGRHRTRACATRRPLPS
jgi:CxxC motif-containing protein (DUF1111 family)